MCRDYVTEVRRCLASEDVGDNSSPTAERLMALTAAASEVLTRRAAAKGPTAPCSPPASPLAPTSPLSRMSLDGPTGRPGQEAHVGVVAAMGLTRNQRDFLCHLRRQSLERQAVYSARRSDALTLLRVCSQTSVVHQEPASFCLQSATTEMHTRTCSPHSI